MKNKNYEYMTKKRKEYLSSNRFRNKVFNKDGIYVYHDYSGHKPGDLSWWDDVGFKYNGNYYLILWVHPRMEYSDMCEEIASIKSSDLSEKIGEPFKNAVPTYKKVGGSRKKISFYTRFSPTQEELAWYDAYNMVKNDELMNGNIVVKPSLSIKSKDYCKQVEICYPLEINNEEDLNALVNLVKDVLVDKTKFKNITTNMSYSKTDWNAEQPK
jgi:hypothetical protein